MTPGKLPQGLRNAAVLCLLLSALVGFVAALDAGRSVGTPEDGQDEVLDWGDPKLNAVSKDAVRVEAQALEEMQGARTATAIGLSVVCALTFVAATRMLKPVGVSRESVRRLLAAGALAAAVLWVIDGAAWTVVNQRVDHVFENGLAKLPQFNQNPLLVAALRSLWWGAIGVTALIGGAFVLLSQYFRSEKVKQIIAFRDRQAD